MADRDTPMLRALVHDWLVRPLRRALGTEPILDWVAATGEARRAAAGTFEPCDAQSEALSAAVLQKIEELYAWLAGRTGAEGPIELSRDDVPVLADVNGDLVWLPGDVLGYLWHARVAADPPFLAHFLAEDLHYHWLRRRLRRGQTAIDCGANLGIFTAMMAARVGPTGSVHAFEPSRSVFRDLSRVVALNGFTWVAANRVAVADRCGTAEFLEVAANDARREASPLAGLGREPYLSDVAHERVQTPVITLDRYCEENKLRPSAIKIDVEGAEFLVLAGAEQCLAACKPALAIEIHPDPVRGFDHERLEAGLRRHGYRIGRVDKTYYAET